MTGDEPEVVSSPAPARGAAIPRVVAGSVLVLIGLLWLLERIGWFDFTVTTVLALATLAVGLVLTVLAFRGAHPGLVAFGVVLAVLTTVSAFAPVEGFQGGIGDRTVEPAGMADLRSDYNLAMGTLTIDLTGLEEGDVGTVNASVGMGELRIVLPAEMAVDIRARAGMGEVQILDMSSGGIGVDESFRSAGFEGASSRLSIEARVFMGQVEVTQR